MATTAPPASTGTTAHSSQSPVSGPANRQLNEFQLGDSLGKGAFGQVYRALNWATGETVAVKEIQLSNIPKEELGEIMSEIDLLKNLNHPNIVKYKGFVKTREFLYIILEFCENGSLHNICKRFGKFPENLVAVYISQVLEGLVYLHEQGVIHRDIKGANILTNKDGSVKLADFGVASRTVAGAVRDDVVVGSPYWMAPEVIEQTGATTASDIWSVGCVVIELLDGKPPYHFLDPMPALFRIVQDDCPPIPEGASPIVKDFLYHCFQKDVNLRISAKKLLRHPWMVSARRHMKVDPKGPQDDVGKAEERKPASNYNFDQALLKVREWNEALKSPSKTKSSKQYESPPNQFESPHTPTGRHRSRPSSGLEMSNVGLTSLEVGSQLWRNGNAAKSHMANGNALGLVEKNREPPFSLILQSAEEQTDNWDDDFEEGISLSKLQALEKTTVEDNKLEIEDNAQTIRPGKSPGAKSIQLPTTPNTPTKSLEAVEDYSDLAAEEDDDWVLHRVTDFKTNQPSGGLFHPKDIRAYAPTPNSPGLRTVSITEASQSLRPSISPVIRNSSLSQVSHSRSSSYAGSTEGSIGKADFLQIRSSSEFHKYTEDPDEDYEDVFGKMAGHTEYNVQTLQLNTRLSNRSWLGDDDLENDPFAEIDEGFVEDDLETNLQRDKHARLCNLVNQLIDEMTPSAPDFQLRDACDQLLSTLLEAPEMRGQVVSSHGMLVILEVIEGKSASRDVIVKLLQIINLLINTEVEILESFCLIGGIPIIMAFTSKKFSSECRLEASRFISLLCLTSVLTLQMFISCRGLKVLVDLLDEDYVEQKDLVVNALNGICNVFDLQGPTPKNDFCRMFIREGLLNPLSSALINVMAADPASSTDIKLKIIQILLIFCQVSHSDIHVRNALGTRMVIRRLLRACELLEPQLLVQMLKAIKQLSMNATLLDVLQNANTIEIIVRILTEHDVGLHSTELENHIIQTCYNLCRLNKSRQEEAAQAGIITSLKRVIQTGSPLRQFAIPILCDLAGATKSCRTLLWQHEAFSLYIVLLDDPYFQVSALEAILSWLQDETARVEDLLIQPQSADALLKCFVTAKANSFENMLDPLLKFFRLSKAVTSALSKPQFFKRLLDRLSHKKAVVRLALLRLLKIACDVHPNRKALVERYGIYQIVEKLSVNDGAVLVRELAREIKPSLLPVLKPPAAKHGNVVGDTSKIHIVSRPKSRRTASETSVIVHSTLSSSRGSAPATSSNLVPSRRVKSSRRTVDESFSIGDQ